MYRGEVGGEALRGWRGKRLLNCVQTGGWKEALAVDTSSRHCLISLNMAIESSHRNPHAALKISYRVSSFGARPELSLCLA